MQLATAFGAQVTGVASTTKLELVRSIGAEEVIDYTREDFAGGARRWDLVVDTAGRRSLAQLRRALTRRGTLVIVGGEGGGRWLGGFDRLILRAPLLSALVRQRLRPLVAKERRADLLVLKELIEAGKVTPVIDRTYPLREAPRPSGIWSRDTLGGRSSSPCEPPTTRTGSRSTRSRRSSTAGTARLMSSKLTGIDQAVVGDVRVLVRVGVDQPSGGGCRAGQRWPSSTREAGAGRARGRAVAAVKERLSVTGVELPWRAGQVNSCGSGREPLRTLSGPERGSRPGLTLAGWCQQVTVTGWAAWRSKGGIRVPIAP